MVRPLRSTPNGTRVVCAMPRSVAALVAFGLLVGMAFYTSADSLSEQNLRFFLAPEASVGAMTTTGPTEALPAAAAGISDADDPYRLARVESGGFFTDITEEQWIIKKKIFQMTQKSQFPRSNKEMERLSRIPAHFYTSCYQPEFTCSHEVRLGVGDGGKWVCDPHRITNKLQQHDAEPCLVYSVGVKRDVQFESGIHQHISSECEIHSFDFNAVVRGTQVPDLVKKAGSTFHHWGIKATEKMYGGSNTPWKTLKETIQELGHSNRTLDVLKIDCESCEWKAVHYWLQDLREMNVYARQILLEVHEPPVGAHDAKLLFEAMQKEGYIIFHKEANTIVGGKCYEYAWIRLDLKFQQNQDVL